MEEVSTCKCVSGYYVLELVTNIMKSCIDRYYSQIIQSIARDHLEVSAPHAGAAETLVQGQQVQAVGVLAPLDLVVGAGLDTGLGRVSTTQGQLTLLARHGHRTPATLLSPGYRVTITEWTLASTTCTTCTDK